ncbi:MAG TPA: MFS transporter [Acidimicrobiia bacterium]|jgi:MFS family permease
MVTRDPHTYALNPFGRLAVAHAVSVVGDAGITVSLAGSIFFTTSVGASQGRVLLYLLLTLAPFAIVAPVIGPVLDRSRAGRRTLMAFGCFGRAIVCVLIAGNLHTLFLYPLAFLALVFAKGHQVAKSALVPAVVRGDQEFVAANSRLSLISIAASVIGGLPAAALVKLVGGGAALGLSAVVFVIAGLLCFRIPSSGKPTPVETPEEREELAAPSIVFAGTAMAMLRGGVGFLAFFLAFQLKKAHEPAWFFGVVLVASLLGGLVGVLSIPVLRKRLREESILACSLLVPALAALFSARDGGRTGAVLTAFVVAIGAGAGRIAFDSLLQRDGPDRVRGRAFARFETRFQLAWVVGGLIPVALLDVLDQRVGFFLLALVLGFSGLSYVAGLRARHEWGGPARQREPGAEDVKGVTARSMFRLRPPRRKPDAQAP